MAMGRCCGSFLAVLAVVAEGFFLCPPLEQGVRRPRGVVVARATETEDEVVGVDMWGEAVTARDMTPAVLPEVPAAEVPKTYVNSDFAGSEWKIGILWRNAKKFDVTWFRCLDDGTAVWGFPFDPKGKWKLDEGAYLTVTREFFLGWHGKRIYTAKTFDDPNYLEGVVRGWRPWTPANVMGRWQAIRLGVDRPNPPPWLQEGYFDEDDDDDEQSGDQAEKTEKQTEQDDDEAHAAAAEQNVALAEEEEVLLPQQQLQREEEQPQQPRSDASA